jgi:superfamily I DNA/RNA helicase
LVEELRAALKKGALSEPELAALSVQLSVSTDELIEIGISLATAESGAVALDVDEADAKALGGKVVFTSITGSKGLSAAYVFIVGVNGGHFPRSNGSPSDQEVCQFLVALSRTRKECSIVSVKNFGGSWLDPSIFGLWLHGLTTPITVNKTYLEKA